MTIPEFPKPDLEGICNVLGDTTEGLTGGEIAQLLSDQGIADPEPSMTKRHRLFQALYQRQQRDACGNNVAAFIKAAMAPVRYSANLPFFEARRSALNTVLAFSGYNVASDGEIEATSKAATLDEAQNRADSLAHTLRQRGVHADVLRFCRAELMEDNYFHAVLEATKSVAEKIRERTGLTTDGGSLVDAAFGGEHPMLALNTLRTETERSEQSGFVNLLKGMFGHFRNPTAHAPRISWPIGEEDALDLLTLASYLQRRIDAAVMTRSPQNLSSVESLDCK